MANFEVQLDAENNIITIRYQGIADYKMLLESLGVIVTIYLPKRVHIVLDFSEVETFIIRYRHIKSFRCGLKTLLPNGTVNSITVVDPPVFWRGILCSSNPLEKKDARQFDFELRNIKERPKRNINELMR